MIENERQINSGSQERLYAIFSGSLIGLATGLYLFAEIPPMISFSILMEGLMLGSKGARKVMKHMEFQEDKKWGMI